MRIALTLAFLATALPACADAPIVTEDLQPNGELRATVYEQAGFTAPDRPVQQAIRISAVLASQDQGALTDASAFGPDTSAVHLHLRADGLLAPRPVIYRWTQNGERVERVGLLAAGDTMSLASSQPLVGPGTYTVEVLGLPTDAEPAPVLYERTFEVAPPVPVSSPPTE